MPGMEKWNKGPRHKTAFMPKERKDILYEFEEGHTTGGRKANDLPVGSE
jgi:hypothetical protein